MDTPETIRVSNMPQGVFDENAPFTNGLLAPHLKNIHKYNLCDEAYIEDRNRDGKEGGYVIWMRLKGKQGLSYIATARATDTPRLWKSVDAAWKYIVAMFQNVKVVQIFRKSPFELPAATFEDGLSPRKPAPKRPKAHQKPSKTNAKM